ncbi:unnamed protein product [Cuscuta epithymum]|uniref:Gag-pol polyprotein n=1 Tax=Cuscuta epithymum TaxID=186058 RepID=A0AAV0C629_9ASTE|nr:unnamed protein product [Cuscuta epithymum]
MRWHPSPRPRSCGKCSCNITKKINEARDRDRLYDFLMGLDDYYSQLKSQILATQPIPTLTAAYHLISEGEQHRMIATSRKAGLEGSAFQAQAKSTSDPNRKINGKEVRYCTHCGKSNHTHETCFEIIGYPANWNTRTKDGRPQGSRVADQRSTRSNDRFGNPQKRGGPPHVAHVEQPTDNVLGFSDEQLQRLAQFMRAEFFQGTTSEDHSDPQINMAGLTLEEADWSG